MRRFAAEIFPTERRTKENYSIPAIVWRLKPKKQALSVEHQAIWLARIRREDLAADATNFTEFVVTILYQVRIKLGVRNSLQGILFEFCCCFLDLTYLKTTRQESDRSRRQPEGSFFVSFYRNLRYQPQLTAGGGATPLPLRAQLVPSNTGTHFTYHEWMES